MCDQAGADGIAQAVAEHREQMSVLLNREALETALPDMAVAMVVPVIAAHVTREPPMDERAEGIRGCGLEHEMEVVGHEAEAEDLDRIAGFRIGEQVEESAVVRVFVKDHRAGVAAVEDMVDMAGALSTRNTRHY